MHQYDNNMRETVYCLDIAFQGKTSMCTLVWVIVQGVSSGI